MTQTALTPAPDAGTAAAAAAPGRFRTLRRFFAPIAQAHGMPKKMLWAGGIITALLVVTAVFAPLIAPYDFDSYKADGQHFPKQGHPGGGHWLGTTVQSFDVLTRVIYGARTALEVMILAVVFSLIIGVLLGLLAGYIGGWLDRILVLVMDALFAFPYLLLAIVAGFMLSNIVGGGVVTAALSITIVYIPQYFRVVRSSALSAREQLYVEAARAMGAKPSTIIRKYLFGNVVQSVPVIATINAGDAISTLAGLGFLGLGIQPTEAAEWGYDLQRSIDDVGAGMWWTALYPGLAIVLAILGFTLLGEGLNDVYNPTVRRRKVTRAVLGAASGRTRLHEAAAEPAAADGKGAEQAGEDAPGGGGKPAKTPPSEPEGTAEGAAERPTGEHGARPAGKAQTVSSATDDEKAAASDDPAASGPDGDTGDDAGGNADSATASAASAEPTGDADTAAGKKAAEEPAGKKSAGKKPAEGEPAGKKPAGDRPAAKKTARKKAAQKKPAPTEHAAGKATAAASTADGPAPGTSADDAPADGTSGGKPAGGKPSGGAKPGRTAGKKPAKGASATSGAKNRRTRATGKPDQGGPAEKATGTTEPAAADDPAARAAEEGDETK